MWDLMTCGKRKILTTIYLVDYVAMHIQQQKIGVRQTNVAYTGHVQRNTALDSHFNGFNIYQTRQGQLLFKGPNSFTNYSICRISPSTACYYSPFTVVTACHYCTVFSILICSHEHQSQSNGQMRYLNSPGALIERTFKYEL